MTKTRQWSPVEIGSLILGFFGRETLHAVFDLIHKDLGRFKCRDKVFRNLECNVLLDMTSDLFGSLFNYKRAKAPYVDVFSLKNVSIETRTSTFGTPVFSEIMFTRSAFRMA